ncbi:MEKHLA domain-containing protein [Halalkalibacter sp. AB-rgal2]|uniref:MEKHLA domain-containing protein n=1 Tax=Halalkalibacter sp. AB-rgal2 TaxID=3242695 RepID=UPI00359CBC0D
MNMSKNGYTEQHVIRLNNSFKRWIGRDLIPLDKNKNYLQQFMESKTVILSHGIEADPILNFGNQAALTLWEMDRATFLKTPSRLTAEPTERTAREHFIRQVKENNFVDHYTGIRISNTGKRFYIKQAIVWNMIDEKDHYYGQAAAFADYEYV